MKKLSLILLIIVSFGLVSLNVYGLTNDGNDKNVSQDKQTDSSESGLGSSSELDDTQTPSNEDTQKTSDKESDSDGSTDNTQTPSYEDGQKLSDKDKKDPSNEIDQEKNDQETVNQKVDDKGAPVVKKEHNDKKSYIWIIVLAIGTGMVGFLVIRKILISRKKLTKPTDPIELINLDNYKK